MIARLALLLACLLAGCAHATAPVAVGAAGEVDYRCETDSDCAIKDVGNCCGHYPACVNKDSPTFPEQVKAECAREGRMSICGFPTLTGCQCVNQRCEGIQGAASEAEAQ